ncbi:MAG: hypothetical protein ABIU30_06135, partial [Ferruginibacter sp.]
MKKLSLFFLLAGTLLKISATAQGVGIGTTTPKAAFNVAENKTVLFGRDTIGGGGKMMWIPSKYAFRAGVIGNLPVYNGNPADGNIWDYDSIGLFSFAAGYQNKASSAGSIAIGALNQSSGITAIALGQSNIVSGLYSFSAGVNNVTSGSASTTIGSQNKTYNDNATAIGRYNIAKGEGSTAIGYGAQANSYVSIALGLY